MSDYLVESVPTWSLRWVVVKDGGAFCRCREQADAERIARALRLLEAMEQGDVAITAKCDICGATRDEHYSQPHCFESEFQP